MIFFWWTDLKSPYFFLDEKYAKNGVDDMKDASINKDAVKEEWEEKMEALFQSYKSSQVCLFILYHSYYFRAVQIQG